MTTSYYLLSRFYRPKDSHLIQLRGKADTLPTHPSTVWARESKERIMVAILMILCVLLIVVFGGLAVTVSPLFNGLLIATLAVTGVITVRSRS
jgi:hypothetical protein